MPLLGSAAMLLSFDVAPEAIDEHDDWHTHEHLPERLSIPGFLRATRWTALRGKPRYFVMYEVEHLATLTSQPYLNRLNDPSPWTAKMMPHYSGMTRAFCSVAASFGLGIGGIGLLMRFESASLQKSPTRDRLLPEQLESLPDKAGIGSVHWFEAALTPPMTTEQRIRGADATVGRALLLTGYREEALQDALASDFRHSARGAQRANDMNVATYRLDYALTRRELDA